ncbi:Decapping and exoribonuclease protein [Hypsibius exemplaris]|uniref:Decapping nuclease n=1 Tax=Hypsibius exemplaris TaxID=2072580 RepID=A0A1W0WSK5_HYPEX|nr:Decapping and exoribonuclease protein [Hypsibius exemplaris]
MALGAPIFPRSSMRDIQQFDGGFPSFSQPQEVGCFSLSRRDDQRRQYHDDARALKPLVRRGPGPVVTHLNINLDQGMDVFIDHKQEYKMTEHLEFLLQWIAHHPTEFNKLRSKIQMVCWRGKLHELLTTPYDRQNGWILCVCKIDGILYMSSFENRNHESRRLSETKKDRTFMYWGFKFEQYMTNQPDDEKEFRKPVDNFESFQTVLFSRLKNTGILYGAEMDCYDPEVGTEKAPDRYVELKTARNIENNRQYQNFCNHKLMKFWAQSFIAGVPLIVVGFRNDYGRVSSTEEIPTQSISRRVRENGQPWLPNICANFLADFLLFVRQIAVEEYDKAIYRFEWNPGAEKIACTVEAPDSAWKFIPDWYMEARPKSAKAL